ncbi:MobF family relaxase [Pimelobacter simplex]|uniref:MobF family relaxase n=1 Tax=Nocardioides simplex TaxID=2045 RepID=UPI00214FDA15|nr:MobF family relaxase [Pimelobacter simplex]UUW92511.1 relaxase domain-containing protein [Pimelobacter simplex]UUW96339.1 relaxase domain-containing protein [Pimelobacter simplex]
MGVHKLTAGDGYTYLTRQVAVHDATDRGHAGLADYYAGKGESPGRWFGAGLGDLGLAVGSEVTEAQMRNLFGEGRHPDAERLENAALDAGKSVAQAKKASQLGRVFAIYRGNQPEFLQETAKRYAAYNLSRGEHWKTRVPAEIRAKIRTALGNEYFLREHGRAPIDDRERGSFMAKATRQQTTAVAGYDLTFAPVKSVSTLWALADRDVAQQIEAAHHSAVEATLSWLEQEVLFTRRGRGGLQQVRAKGLIAGMFTHRDARSSDPHLHTHVAVSNKVQDETGRWLAVDGRVLFKANVTLAEMYNTLIESELIARLGVRFENRRSGPNTGHGPVRDKRPVREIVGVYERLAAAWSKRHHAIEARRRELAAAFQAEHGRPPTEGEAVTLAEQAWEQTRQAKHAPRAEADQRAAWLAEAIAIIGSEQAVRDMVEQCLGHTPDAQDVTDEWVGATAKQVVERVAEDRATWQVWHLRAEAQRQARAHGIRLADLDAAVDRVVATATGEHCLAFKDPDPLTHPTTAAERDVTIPAPLQRTERGVAGVVGGQEVVSVYSLAGARQYTSQAVVDAERRIIASARRSGGRTISEVRISIAIAEAAANSDTTGLQLNAAQQSLVREMATSGRAVQLALAPAGTGKTTAMAVLARAWQDSGGTVIGLAPSAVAAQELGAAINPDTSDAGREDVRADTLAKLVWHAQHPDEHGAAPAWMERINAKTLVLIDEAGMAATTDLAAAVDYITSRGGQVRLIGDDRQLASVAAGGVLRDIAHQVGAVTLSEVHRFRNPDGSLNHAEAAATLALREGDPSAIAYYADRGRIHVGDLGACADQAYAAWAADRARSTGDADSILIAPTRDLVAELNTRARNDRLAGRDEVEIGRGLTLADGTKVSQGDRIITRENDRRLRISRTNWVKNGDRWHVRGVNADGSLTVVHDQLGKTVTLPAGYVAEFVQLGYATTVHGAQGITTGTCHVVLTGDEDRNLLYVALSRGKFANHLYLNVASDGDPHNLIRPEALIPPTALDRIAQMLRRDGSPVSATTTLREQTNPHQLLGDMAARYHDAVTAGAENLIGPVGMDKIDVHAEVLLTGLTDAPAWPTLRSHLALTALDEHNPLKLLTAAVGVGSLADARDPAAVLDARIDNLVAELNAARPHDPDTPPPTQGPLPWLPGIPARLADNLDWGPFTATYHQLVGEHIDAVCEEARGWTGATAPVWAQPFLEDEDTDLRADLAVWRAVTRADENDLRPTGDRTIGSPGAHQANLNRAVRQARPSYPFSERTWYQELPETVRADPWITPLCQRLARLERAGLPVTDYIKQALATDPSPPGSHSGTHTDTAATARPLPDEQQAAALWWRLVPHLGPAALGADEHSANLLQPTWRTALAELVGPTKADYLQKTPAWPAFVAAVDEACVHHGWNPTEILSSALAGVPQDGSLTGVEVADALVLRIAMLTDRPTEAPTPDNDEAPYAGADVVLADPDLLPPEDADEFMAALYRDQPDDANVPVVHSPTPDEYEALAAEPVDWVPSLEEPDQPSYDDGATGHYPYVEDPYAPPLPWERAAEVTAENAFPDPNQIPAERIHELNQQALAYFESCYPRSWAPGYLRERLGTDLTEHPNYGVGYAPGSGHSLMRHLTAQGATIDELEQAGLVSRRERDDGTTYYRDFFRDRLVMPIRDPNDPNAEAILGFVGRRNPTKTDDDFAGAKYLNTRTTPVFTKGEALFGYAEARERLADGALPVLVEGPMDALAITLGSNGTAVGIAPMGTALTVSQIKLLRTHIDMVNGRDRIAVATDSDPAGRKSAQKAFWHLTAADLDPTHLDLPDGLDPARLFETQGAAAITAAIENLAPLGDAMIDHLLRTAGHWSDTAVRQKLIHQTARILAARGADTWREASERLRNQLHLAPGILEHQTLTESIQRDRNGPAYAQERIDEINDEARRNTARRDPQSRRRAAERRLAPAAVTPRLGQDIPAAGPDPAGPAR